MQKEEGGFAEIESVTSWADALLQSCGLPAASARIAAEVLVDANIAGVETHGISRLRTYVSLLTGGYANADPSFACEEVAGMLVFDADRGLGQVAGREAMKRAIALARDRAFVGMNIKRVGHLGALGYFTAHAAEAGMIALLVQNGPPVMGLHGVTKAAIGNNPLAFSAPVLSGPPLVFDIATSEAAYGKIIEAARAGRLIPEGWALDDTGRPTTEASQALKGTLLAAAGHKGIGLAMMIECLAGGLTGMVPRQTIPDGQTMPTYFGAFLLVINPDLVVGRHLFDTHLKDWIGVFKAAGPDMRYPGERLFKLREERRQTGIPISPELAREMHNLGDGLGHPFPKLAVRPTHSGSLKDGGVSKALVGWWP